MRPSALIAVRTIPARAVEARWRAPESSPPATQAGRGTAAGAVVGPLWRLVGMGVVVVVQAEDVAVVGGAAGDVREDVV